MDSMNPNSGPPPEQDIPLQIPKKTKLYVEQVLISFYFEALFTISHSCF